MEQPKAQGIKEKWSCARLRAPKFFEKMQIKIFTIPMIGSENELLTNEMNSFLRSHRILNVSKELVSNTYMNVWTFCIEYIEGSKPQNSGNHSASTQKQPI